LIKVDFWLRAVGMETGEDFWVMYYDGTTWQNIRQYVSATDFSNNNFYHGIVYINESDFTFPTDMKIKFQCDASDTADDVYIDQITVSAR